MCTLFFAGQSILELHAPQLASRSNHQTHVVALIMRNADEKTIEWNIPILVLARDISKACDYPDLDFPVRAFGQKVALKH